MKNKIHMIRWHDKRRCYVCNWACNITKGKYTDDSKKVTCKNCKKRMWIGIEREPEYIKIAEARIKHYSQQRKLNCVFDEVSEK